MVDQTSANETTASPDLTGIYRPSSATRGMLRLADRFATGRVTAVLPDGRVSRHGAEDGPSATIRLHNDTVARRLFTGGDLGFAESYLDGDWSSPDLAELLSIADRNAHVLAQTLKGNMLLRLATRAMHMLRRNSVTGSRRNIAYHYDLGNAFFERWLDRSMTYSSAEFVTGRESLEDAQRTKYARLADRLDLRPGQHVLEIGCGWGGFAEYAARERQARVTAITISEEQYAYAARRIQRAGLGERVQVLKQDYRHTEGVYDRIASIEMFEAVGREFWPVFFERLRDRLDHAGRAALQVITIADDRFEDYARSADFIQRYIFPGGLLPSPSALTREVERAGMQVLSWDTFGESYATTCRLWNERFQDAWREIAEHGFDERFRRMWEYYLAYCEAGFRTGAIDVARVAIARNG